MTYTESRTALASAVALGPHGRGNALVLCGPVEEGDVLVVRGLRIEVTAVYGDGPYTVPLGRALPVALPAGEPVRVFTPAAVEGQ